MDKKEILNFLNAHPACHVATLDGNTPRTRGLMMHKADENGIVFQIWTVKDVYKQLKKNPAVELCFNDYDKGTQIRVSGKAEFVEDPALKKTVMDARPFLKGALEKMGMDKVSIFQVRGGKANVYTRETNFDPKTYVTL